MEPWLPSRDVARGLLLQWLLQQSTHTWNHRDGQSLMADFLAGPSPSLQRTYEEAQSDPHRLMTLPTSPELRPGRPVAIIAPIPRPPPPTPPSSPEPDVLFTVGDDLDQPPIGWPNPQEWTPMPVFSTKCEDLGLPTFAPNASHGVSLDRAYSL